MSITISSISKIEFCVGYDMQPKRIFVIRRCASGYRVISNCGRDWQLREKRISFKKGDLALKTIVDAGKPDTWKDVYSSPLVFDGWNWRLDIEDITGNVLVNSRGDNNTPPKPQFTAVIDSIRRCSPGFANDIDVLR